MRPPSCSLAALSVVASWLSTAAAQVAGSPCSQARNRLEPGSYAFASDCGPTLWCAANSTCVPRLCRSADLPFGCVARHAARLSAQLRHGDGTAAEVPWQPILSRRGVGLSVAGCHRTALPARSRWCVAPAMLSSRCDCTADDARAQTNALVAPQRAASTSAARASTARSARPVRSRTQFSPATRPAERSSRSSSRATTALTDCTAMAPRARSAPPHIDSY